MNLNLINIFKKGLLIYWASVIITFLFFFDNPIGHYHVLIGAGVFIAHIGETFLFSSTIKKYSDNVSRDKLSVLLYGFLVPTELKLKKDKK